MNYQKEFQSHICTVYLGIPLNGINLPGVYIFCFINTIISLHASTFCVAALSHNFISFPPRTYHFINYDKPDIAAYVGLKTIMEFGNYELIRFHNPSLHLLKLKPSPRLCAEPKGSPRTL